MDLNSMIASYWSSNFPYDFNFNENDFEIAYMALNPTLRSIKEIEQIYTAIAYEINMANTFRLKLDTKLFSHEEVREIVKLSHAEFQDIYPEIDFSVFSGILFMIEKSAKNMKLPYLASIARELIKSDSRRSDEELSMYIGVLNHTLSNLSKASLSLRSLEYIAYTNEELTETFLYNTQQVKAILKRNYSVADFLKYNIIKKDILFANRYDLNIDYWEMITGHFLNIFIIHARDDLSDKKLFIEHITFTLSSLLKTNNYRKSATVAKEIYTALAAGKEMS